MTNQKWPANEPACFGVCCSCHHTCARYAAVDFNTNHEQVFIDHCGPEYALFESSAPPLQLVDLAAKSRQA